MFVGPDTAARSAAPLATRKSITSNLAAWAALGVLRSRLPRTRLSSVVPAIPKSPSSTGIWSAPTATSWSPKWRRERSSRAASSTPGFSPSEYFHELNLLETRLDALTQRIPYLTDDQLVDLFSYFRDLDRRAWKAQAAVLWEAKRRSVYGDRAWEAMGRTFGIGWRQAYNLAKVWEVFFLGEDGQFCNQLQNPMLQEVTSYIVASQTDAPQFWLAYAEDRKAENPAYSISDFREEVGMAGAQREDFEAPPGSEKPRCRWLRTYCMKLGRIVRPGDCSRCDIPITSPEEADHDNDDL